MKKTILISLLSFALGIFTGLSFVEKGGGTVQEKIVRDTVIKTIRPEPLVIEKVKARKVFIRDTVIVSRPYIAIVDTVVRRDTVRAEYEFPLNLFSLDIRRAADSVKIETITISKYIKESRPWWELPLSVAAGAGIGYLAGSAGRD